jgi:hypothetical protein
MNVSANSKKTFLDFVISSFSKKKNYKPEDFKNINDFK